MLKFAINKILTKLIKIKSLFVLINSTSTTLTFKRDFYLVLFIVSAACFLILLFGAANYDNKLIKFISPLSKLTPITNNKNNREVFGFAPYWTFNKLGNIDFNVLTTLAYFGVPVDEYGNLVKSDYGYEVFQSKKATELFTRAHNSGTRVVLTITQMENYPILAILDSTDAQENLIDQAVGEVEKRGIDGINVDFEYGGDPGEEYRRKFTKFVANLSKKMHSKVPSSRVTVSVYAGSVKEPKIYDIQGLSGVSDGIFMMAYDFAQAGADNAIPTAPLYGYKEGKYWYDIATAVDDFLKIMPPQKLILGIPWYSYNYAVYEPAIKAETLPNYFWGVGSITQTYAAVLEKVNPDVPGVTAYKTGWDNLGQVAWKSYFDENGGTWRIVFYDNERSMGAKVDFVKNKNLGGVGIWALGFEDGRKELWQALVEKLGIKFADNNAKRRAIYEVDDNI